ncbi:MAG: right-handed parallel beta-helix repeat-containing protein [Fibrobacteres bacterium]|nr:right-handed parallel beta-helix repeat-containing protein [Fibrobacterota bacterium]
MIRIGIPNRRGLGGFLAGVLRASAALCAASLALSCIERTNPFDPENGGDVPAGTVRKQLESQLKTLAAVDSGYASMIAGFADAFRKDSLGNADIISNNAKQRAINAQRVKDNAAAESGNLTAPPDSLVALQFFVFLDTLKTYGPYAGFDVGRSNLQAQMATVTSFMATANADHSPLSIYPTHFSDSVLAPFARDITSFDLLRASIGKGNAAVADSNAAVGAYNLDRQAANAVVTDYNDSIRFVKQSHDKPPLDSAGSVLAGTAGAQAGDTLLIAKGDYSVDLRFNHSGTPENPIVVRGYPGERTVLRVPFHSSSAMILSANQNIQFQDIVFRGGVQLVATCKNITFLRCVFDSSTSYGLRVVDSDVSLTDCRLIQNAKGAFIQGKNDQSVTFKMKNVLLARNSGSGLDMNIPNGGMRNCTIADNGGDGINVSVPHSGLSILNTIISGNSGTGFLRQRDTEFQDQLDIELCDVWGNKTADWSLEGMDSTLSVDILKANFSIQPEFIAPADLDYGLKPGSTLTDFEHQTVSFTVGYRP